MIELGLIGFPLGHSFSKSYFTEKFLRLGIPGEYHVMPVEGYGNGTLDGIMTAHPGLTGFNVTAPWKRRVIEDMDILSPDAEAIGSVNVVRIKREDGALVFEGHNTDWLGFLESLPKDYLRGDALVLGSGGAAAAAVYALTVSGVNTYLCSRDPGKAFERIKSAGARLGFLGYENLGKSMMEDFSLVVNATPLGTYPDTRKCPPIPYKWIHPDMMAYDMVYNPGLTLFMRKGARAGAAVKNGLEMLHRQAELSWRIWTS